MLLLFVVCALLPIGILSGLSFSRLIGQLNADRVDALRQLSGNLGRSLVERIDLVERELQLVDRTGVTGGKLVERVRGAGRVGNSGEPEVWAGTLPTLPDPPEAKARRLEEGNPVVWLGPDPGVVVLESPADGGVLVAVLDPDYLFGGISPDALWCVLADGARPLFCPASGIAGLTEAFTARTNAQTGELAWSGADGAFVGGYHTIDLDGTYGAGTWTVTASAPRADFFTAVGSFGRAFPWVIILTLLGAFLISHQQIRRSLRPLKALQEATKRVADRRFGEPVRVTSGDEFEELGTAFNAMVERVETQFRALTTMNEITRSVLATPEIDQIVTTVLDRTPNIAPCDVVLFAHPAREPPGAWTVTWRRVGGTLTESETVEPTTEEVEELWTSSECILLDLNTSPRSYIDLVEFVKRGFLRFAVFPVQNQGEVGGLIALGYGDGQPPDPEALDQIRRLADQVTVAISNASLLAEMNRLNFGTLAALARTIDASSPWTHGHSERVTTLALAIARRMRLPTQKIETLRRGGLLHDIGKIGTPHAILNKTDRLTPDELAIMQDHTRVGAKILAPIPQYADILPIVRYHHERMDGKGYPDGLKGNEIPFLARVLAVADVFDALRSDRPYRPGWKEERVISEIQRVAGTHLDPEVVEAFLMIKAPTLSGVRKSLPYLSAEIEDFYSWID